MNKEQAAALLQALVAEHGADVLVDLCAAGFRADSVENVYDDEWTQTDALREWCFGIQESVESCFD